MRTLKDGFSTPEAAKLARLSVRKLDTWERTGFLKASISAPARGISRQYTFRDVIALRIAGELRASGVSVQMIRRIVEHLRKREGLSATDALASTNLVTNGENVYEVCGDVVIKVPTGQRVMVHVIPLHSVVSDVQRKARSLRTAA